MTDDASLDREIIEFKPTTSLVDYRPEEGLKRLAVAEAAEKHFARAKDTEQLYKAIEMKLRAQRDFVRWWDGLGEKRGGDRKSDQYRSATALIPIAGNNGLPQQDTIDRWGKRTRADEDFARALEDGKHRCRRILEAEKDGTIRGTEGTGEFERYTPAEYIEAAREVLGEIDLDPATCEQAQQTVQAKQFFTTETDGLRREWHGRVWLNPPYHRELAPAFIDKLVQEFDAERVSAAIVLTNNCTDTEWFSVAASACTAICFTRGRIKFTVPTGPPVLPTQGQAFFYLGNDVERFAECFCAFGLIVIPWRP